MVSPFQPDPTLAAEHRKWLLAFDPQYQVNWEKLLNADPEAGMCEAAVRRLLQNQGLTVEPNEDLTGSQQSPDYRCSQEGTIFYVEVTCLAIEKVTQDTGLVHGLQGRSGLTPFSPLNDAIFHACKGKASQCGGLSHPALVAVGTFHSWVSMICIKRLHVNMLLTGQAKMTWDVDMQSGEQVGDVYQTTELFSAAFLRPDKSQAIGYARSSISGLLLCGFGCEPPKVMGLLHPNPVRPFSSQLMPQVPFCEVRVDHTTGDLCTHWTGGGDE